MPDVLLLIISIVGIVTGVIFMVTSCDILNTYNLGKRMLIVGLIPLIWLVIASNVDPGIASVQEIKIIQTQLPNGLLRQTVECHGETINIHQLLNCYVPYPEKYKLKITKPNEFNCGVRLTLEGTNNSTTYELVRYE